MDSLFNLAVAGRFDDIQSRLDANQPNARGHTGLHGARDIRTIRLLIDAHANVDAKNNWGATPLMFAAIHKSTPVAVFQCLIDADADLDAVSNEYTTALHYLASTNNTTLLQCLVRAGCRTDIRGPHRKTALDLATEASAIAFLKLHSRVNVLHALTTTLADDVPMVLLELIADFVTSI